MTVLVLLGLAALVATVTWRPHGAGPAAGALAAVALAAAGGAVSLDDVRVALAAQWRAYLTLGGVMLMTTAAERLGLLEHLAALIEPRTRGPVRHAFRMTFALSAVVAAVLSNDAAILLMTPTVLVLLRTVYPRRHPKFLVPFAFAVFAAAGVAPLVISNPMNLVFADHVGLGFNAYAALMIPVALASTAAAYLALAWVFREVLADPAPALGAWPAAPPPITAPGRVVLAAVALSLGAYPVLSYVGAPLWPVALAGGATSVLAAWRAGHAPATVARGVAWPIFPFLLGVFVLAIALERIGLVARLVALFAGPAPLPTIGVVSAVGSALLNNHPMSVLSAFALEGDPSHAHACAALVGGDLGPRLLPVGSLAALLWFDLLRRHGVVVPLRAFVRVGVALTVPSLAVALAVLALVGR